MLLILTNSRDVTADFLEERLRRQGVDLLRIDTDVVLSSANAGYTLGSPVLRYQGRRIVPADVSNVWCRRPEPLCAERYGDTPEDRFAIAEWSEVLEAFLAHVPPGRWMNHPARNSCASRKLHQLTLAREIGFDVPETLVSQDPVEVRSFYDRHGGRIVTKPLSAGYVDRGAGGRDSLIYTNSVRAEHLADLAGLSACPTLFQVHVEKLYDVRITVIDEAFHPVALEAKDPDGSQRCDIRRNNMADVGYRRLPLPEPVEGKIRRLMREYGLRFGAVDMACDSAGRWWFLEINPSGQWAWQDIAGVTDIAASFVESFSGRPGQ